MDVEKRSEKSHELSLRYQEAQHQEVLVVKDEETRRQKVQVVLLQEENTQLKDQVSQLDYRIGLLSSQYDDARANLDSTEQKCRAQENQLRAQARDHSTLRAELLSMNSVTQDSTKVLAEKLALFRELSVLKPEVEHLRSQLTHQKDVLAEKLALERQLNALEVELANEKRSAQRVAQRQASQDSEVEGELREQVQDLEKKLASEKRAREKSEQAQSSTTSELQQKIQSLEAELASEKSAAEQQRSKQMDEPDGASVKLKKRVKELEKALEEEKRESQRSRKVVETELSEARGQTDVFELRIGDLKAKLREVRDELRSSRAEVANLKEKADKKAKTAAKAPGQTQRKRQGEEPSGPEPILQTPALAGEGRTKRPLKKRGYEPTFVIEKSTFSITPFLNKTANLTDDSTDAAAAGANKSKTSEGGETSVADKTTVSTEPAADEMDTAEDSVMEESAAAAETMPLDDAPAATEPSAPVVSKKAEQKTDAASAPKRRGRPPKEKVLSDASASKRNAKVVPNGSAATTSEPTANKAPAEKTSVDESANEQENRLPAAAVSVKEKNAAISVKEKSAAVSKTVAEAEPKKKKRKILGASSKKLFDDEDGDGDKEDGALSRPVKAVPPTAAVAKRAVKMGTGRSMVAGGKRTTLGGVRNAFAAVGGFSPLKREKRGVNASFLA